MAQPKYNNLRDIKTNVMNIGMNKDADPQLIKEGQYTHAINAKLNNHDGTFSFIQNEPSFTECLTTPLPYISSSPLQNKRHVIFSGNGKDSEIGIFHEETCKYEKVINDRCLNFNKKFPPRAVSQILNDCDEVIYFVDNNNPNRYININDIPRVEDGSLDCDNIKLNPPMNIPCMELHLSTTGGKLRNGAYQVAMAYSEKGVRTTSIHSVTNHVSVFSHEELGGSLQVDITNLDRDWSEFILYVLYTDFSGTTTVYEYGVYDTEQSKIHINNLDTEKSPTIPLGDVVVQSVIYDSSRDITTVDDRLLLIGAKSKKRINYQQQANQINTEWVAYAVRNTYYRTGGSKVGYMRDENYGFGIQWLYDTGDWSEAFHIPGPRYRAEDLKPIDNLDAYESYDPDCEDKGTRLSWQLYNTSQGNISIPSDLDKCEEIEIGSGYTGYSVSEEKYPNNPEIWGQLAGENIRLHKMPDICKVPYKAGSDHNIILGVRFTNIQRPLDCDGNPVTNIKGYRIVRTDRTNHKTILGKGLLFNAGEYKAIDTGEKILYPNYPYNDLSEDQFLTKELTRIGDKKPRLNTFKQNVFTFHSPSYAGFDAKRTFGTDLFIEGEMNGVCSTRYQETHNHPKHVVITDMAFVISFMFGIGGALLKTSPKIRKEIEASGSGATALGVAGAAALLEEALNKAKLIVDPGVRAGLINTAFDVFYQFVNGLSISNTSLVNLNTSPDTFAKYNYTLEDSELSILGLAGSILANTLAFGVSVGSFMLYVREYTNIALDTIKNISKYRQFAYQVNSHAEYTNQVCNVQGNSRRRITDISYIYPQNQIFDGQTVNNWRRESSVIIKTSRTIDNPKVKDTSRRSMEDSDVCKTKNRTGVASSHYGSIRRKLPSQYGQIHSFSYLDTGYCEHNIQGGNIFSTGVVFGGDTYLNNFTIKRKMQYFTQTASNNVDGYEFDYSLYPNVAYPRYWLNTFEYDLEDLIKLEGSNPIEILKNLINLPSAEHNFDCKEGGVFTKKNVYFYLSNNGILDFPVESEYNLDLRDWDDREGHRHYDKREYTNLKELFRQDILDIDNKYIYNQAYSKQLVENYIKPQDRDFSCEDEKCFAVHPNQLMYSLQYSGQGKIDTWRSFLPANYYEFPKNVGNLVTVKTLDRNNTIFLFENSSPWIISAQDTLQTDGGIKFTIGDGGLFNPPPRPIMDTDTDYGSAQTEKSIVSTQHGIFYPSVDQGRVFLMRGTQLEEISREGMNWWFKENMPFKLVEDFPDVKITNNLNGLGYSSVFDNKDEIFYLSKRDYKVKEGIDIDYDSEKDVFLFEGRKVSLTDTRYFDDLSWTISYSPLTKSWVSFHDWHPDDVIQTVNTPLSVKNNTIYRHNDTCSSYCYFYGTQHSFDVEYVVNNGQQTSTLSSIEYSLEAYKYFNNCKDKHHLLDYNFNRAFIYNTEQISGLLHLNVKAKNRLSQVGIYPRIELNYIDIECSKEEQKYRFNQFWDVAKDRSEFNSNYVEPLSTQPNGYRYSPNLGYIDYRKPIYQRKKLRHNWHKIYLSRVDKEKEMNKMILKFINNKQILSPR